jgi:hypothetical protein
VLAVLLVLSACEVQVDVLVDVEEDGSGEVTVAVGLDEGAVARVGDPASRVRTEDLAAAGWQLEEPEERDGVVWLQASKPFANPDDLDLVLDEVAAGEVFGDFGWESTETDSEITRRLTGAVDLSGGTAVFSDEAVAALLDGDPYGGNLEVIEAEEGRPVEDMVTMTLRVQVPGAPEAVYTPTLTDTGPVAVDVTGIEQKPADRVWLLAVAAAGAVVVAVMLLGVRRRFRHRR